MANPSNCLFNIEEYFICFINFGPETFCFKNSVKDKCSVWQTFQIAYLTLKNISFVLLILDQEFIV